MLNWVCPAEDDPALAEEDKALARFQVHRIKEAKKATKFALSGDDDAAAGRGSHRSSSKAAGKGLNTLTHGGISLEELEELNSRWVGVLANMHSDHASMD